MENDTIVHNDSASLLTEIIQGISQSWKGKEKGECDTKKGLQTAVKSTATYSTAAPLRSDVAVTLFVIYRVLITSTAIFALHISHNPIWTLHLYMHLTTSLIVLHTTSSLWLQYVKVCIISQIIYIKVLMYLIHTVDIHQGSQDCHWSPLKSHAWCPCIW